MLHTPIAQVTTLMAILVTAWAAASGRWPEKLAAAAVAVDWAGGVLFQDHRFHHHIQPVSFALDVGQATVMLALVVRCRRTWVLWAAAFCLLLVLTHLTVMLDASFGQWSYLTVSYVWSIGLLLSLGAGVGLEGRAPVQAVGAA